jgi:ATP-dependent helicase/nuclease subunit A
VIMSVNKLEKYTQKIIKMSQNLQQIASNPENSAWVFASAGSGKTRILTNRVLRLLLADIPANKILCLTFTNAGAKEMQQRIAQTLSSWAIFSDEELKNNLREISGENPSSLQIKKARLLLIKILDSDAPVKVQTIHSFCQFLIKSFPFEANIKPNFELLDENGEKLLLKEAQNNLRKTALRDEKTAAIISEIHSKIDEERLSQLVAKILDKKEQLLFLKENFFNQENIAQEIFKKLGIKKDDNEEQIFQKFLEKIDKDKLLEAARILAAEKAKTTSEIGLAIIEFLSDAQFENFENYKIKILTKENRARKISNKIEAVALEIFNEHAAQIQDFIDEINSLEIAKDSALLLNFCYLILENYQQIKKAKSLLDYDDLIFETSNLLENSQYREFIKMRMDSGFDHILIDESQDTNLKQWNIIKALSDDFFSGLGASKNKRSIFVVGDEKQSIFSFQGADINISAQVFLHFKNILGDDLKEISLNISYRSCGEILAAVDRVFSNESRQNAITKLGQYEQHQPFRKGEGVVEIWQNIKNDKIKKAQDYQIKLQFLEEEEEKEAKQMAEIIASKIKNWVENCRIIAAKNRAVNYGDIMILLRRRHNRFSKYLTRALQKYQVPFNTIAKIKFSENLLAQDLIAAAKFALLKEDDLNLACLLKSPFFLVSEEKLLEFCLRKNELGCSLYQALDDLEIKNFLDEIIKKSRQLNCFEFFYYLIYQSGFDKNFIAYFDIQAITILNQFLEVVANFAEKNSQNLQHFLEFVENVDPQISLNESSENAVRISTIHSAKGLQAPIVFLPDCCFNLRRQSEEIFEIDGLPIYCASKEKRNNLLNLLDEKRFTQNYEESLRQLYVALTRPEDELYIGGFGVDNAQDCWYEIIRSSLPELVKSEVEMVEIFKVEGDEIKELREGKTPSFDGVTMERDGVTMERDGVAAERGAAKFNNFMSGVIASEAWQSNMSDSNHGLPRHFASRNDENKEARNDELPYRNDKNKEPRNQLNQGTIKGSILHKIFEIYGKNHKQEKNWLKKLTQNLIEKEFLIDEKTKNEILAKSFNFLDSQLFAEIFSGEIKCEFEINFQQKLYRLDLLAEKENEVLIIDYKSDENLSKQDLENYKKQLEFYQKAAAQLYPNKKISSAILMINSLELIKLF